VRSGAPRSPDDGVIADVHTPFDDPAAHAARLSQTPGVVDHGLFAAALVSDVLIARGGDVEHRTVG
jgi:ribose 5-phosphate isomerase